MSASGGPDLVQNGLVVCFDLSNSKSYRGSGAIINDLSNNSNIGTLINTPTYSSINKGRLTFNGTNQYISTNIYANNIGIYNASYTAEAVFSASNAGAFDSMVFGSLAGGQVRKGWHLGMRNNAFYFGQYGNDFAGGAAVSNTIYHVVWILNLNVNTGYIYVNGKFNASNSLNSFISDNPIWLAQAYDVGTYFGGNIYLARIYNRVLSETEISQNYNSLKGRFLLT
jgi:hypothetical protein